jgi:O-antigen/teichoic acid export membrane protein
VLERVKKLVEDGVILTVGNGIFGVSKWLLTVAIANYSGPQALGLYMLSFSIINPLFSFGNLQLRSVISTYLDRSSADHLLLLRVLCILFVLTISVVVAPIINAGYTLLLATIFLGVFKSAESLSQLSYGLSQSRGNYKVVSLSLIYRGVTCVAVLSLSLLYFDSFIYSLISMSLTWPIIFVISDYGYIRDELVSRNLEELMSMHNILRSFNLFKELAPLGVSVLIASLASNTPRYLLEYLSTKKTIGIFGALYTLSISGKMIGNALAHSLRPKLRERYISKGNLSTEIVSATFIFVILLPIVGLLSFFIGPPAVEFIYGSKFATSLSSIVVIGLLSAIEAFKQILHAILHAMHIFWVQQYVVTVSLVVVLATGYLYIQSYPLFGSCISLAAGSSTTCFVLFTISFVSNS